MNLAELALTEKESYNQFVASSPSGSFLQSWEWGEWQAHLGRTVSRFKIIDDSGEQVASTQLIKMPLPFGRYYLYAPYGPVGAKNYEFGIKNYEWLLGCLKEKFINAVFIRIESKDSPLAPHPSPLIKTKNIQPGKTLLIDLTKPEEQLLSEMHHKTRYNIKLAQKHGVEIKDEFDISIGHGLFAKEAVGLIAETAKRQGFKGYGSGYYNKLIDFLAISNRGDLNLRIYKAVYQNQILASAIMVDFGQTRVFLFGGSSEENKSVMAPYLLHWTAMRDAKSMGLNFYDFWGIETASGSTPGFVRFKLGFGGKEQQYAGAYDVVIKNFMYKFYSGMRFGNRVIKKMRFD